MKHLIQQSKKILLTLVLMLFGMITGTVSAYAADGSITDPYELTMNDTYQSFEVNTENVTNWYKFTLDEASEVTITENIIEGGGLKFRLYYEDPAAECYTSAWGNSVIKERLPQGTWYMSCILWNEAEGQSKYQVKAKSSSLKMICPIDDEVNPVSYDVEKGAVVNGLICKAANAADVYQFTPSITSNYILKMDYDASITYELKSDKLETLLDYWDTRDGVLEKVIHLEKGTTYTWKLTEGYGHNIKYSFYIKPEVKKLKTPSLSGLKATTKGLKLSWKKVDDASKYRVFRKDSKGKWSKLKDTTATSYTDKTVKSGKKYTYTVRCVNADGTRYESSYNKTGKTSYYLAAPTVRAKKSGKNKVVTWNEIPGAKSYQVYRRTSKGSWEKIAAVKTLKYTDKKTKAGVKYYYTVRAIRDPYKSSYVESNAVK